MAGEFAVSRRVALSFARSFTYQMDGPSQLCRHLDPSHLSALHHHRRARCLHEHAQICFEPGSLG
jgi:hypothetical protein